MGRESRKNRVKYGRGQVTLLLYWPTLMRRFSCACMPNSVVLGCLEVSEKFVVVGCGWWVDQVGIRLIQLSTGLKVEAELGKMSKT